MHISNVQQLMAAVGWYAGLIDNDAGPKTWAAISKAEAVERGRYSKSPGRWSKKRRLIGAGQAALAVLGFEPGAVDGYDGHNTGEALAAFLSERAGTSSDVSRTPLVGVRSHPAQKKFPLQRDMGEFYGKAGGAQCTAGKVDLPFPMIIAWNRRQKVNRFSCHEKLAAPLTSIYRETLSHYGLVEVRRLELDVFGGCFNHRKKRGGSTLSTHAYGAAVDQNPGKNQLRWGADRAQFARAEYEPFWRIVMEHGGTPAGYAWGKDWMHFQFARLS
ncbi:hypothetical protein LCGC14_0669980 [marine sediment metagenome]|uniref:Peptidase M15C domain-containing protein n=1 Tax=marine sediment metagenome TaxID=412755 RepID=A0A0F9QWA6_9ZZZZ